MKYNDLQENKFIGDFLFRWVQHQQKILKTTTINAAILSTVITTIGKMVAKLENEMAEGTVLDHHKLGAIRVIALYSFRRYLFSDAESLSEADANFLASILCVDVLVASMESLDKKRFYQEKDRKRDLRHLLAAQIPHAFSLSMIGYLLEKEFPKASMVPVSV